MRDGAGGGGWAEVEVLLWHIVFQLSKRLF